MNILGLSGGHDANWALLCDGRIAGAFEKERFTRRRHDGGEVASLALRSLQLLGLEPSEIGLLATSEAVHKGLDPGGRRLGGQKYTRADRWEHQIVELYGRILPAVSVPHHLCHAAYAAYTSPFEDCLAITLDGGGDFYTEEAYTCASISMWKQGRLQFLEPVPNVGFGSLWFTYARALFGDGNHAGKLMGLAAYGDDQLTSALHERFTAPLTGTFRDVRVVKDCWPDFEDPPFLKGVTSWRDATAARVARAVQDLTTRCALDFIQAAQRATCSRHLVIGGGVALNGYLTTAVRQSGLFDEVHVPPAVHDGGIALGAALFAQYHVLGESWRRATTSDLVFLGHDYARLSEEGLGGLPARRLDPGEAAEVCGPLLAAGEIIAVYEGRSEHGPRALGHRSLLASASVAGMRDQMNARVKSREAFRPLAPVVRESRAEEYFEIPWKSPNMMYIVDCTEQARSGCAEACHIDGTARVQTVPDDGGFLSLSLRAFEAQTGVPVLINTSFNRSEPIVETPEQALATFRRLPISTMWLDGWLLQKRCANLG